MSDADRKVLSPANPQVRFIFGRPPLRAFALVSGVLLLSTAWLALGLTSTWSGGEHELKNEAGATLGRDFIAFWSASRVALEEGAAAAYDRATMLEFQSALLDDPDPLDVPWVYPPTGLLLVLPLGLVPYRASLLLWLAVSSLLLMAVLWRVLRDARLLAAAAVFPGITLALVSGQSSILIAALLGTALLVLERNPWLAGLCFAIVTFKPQFALLIGPALLFGRHWKALAGMILSTLALVVTTVMAFGSGIWTAFFEQGLATQGLLGDVSPVERMPTVLAASKLIGLNDQLGFLLQGAAALLALAVVGWVWSRRGSLETRGSVLILATLLASPYAFDYDLTLLILPLAWLAVQVARAGWLRGDGLVFAGLWLAPVAAHFVAVWTGFQPGPLLLALLLWAAVGRARRVESAFVSIDL